MLVLPAYFDGETVKTVDNYKFSKDQKLMITVLDEAEEKKIPVFDERKDYSAWPVGSPVFDEGQVWTLIQPHNAANYDGRPSTLRSLWGLCHTKDPKKAKPWVDAYGTSGMYMIDECYLGNDGIVYRALQDNLVYDAVAYPKGWEMTK